MEALDVSRQMQQVFRLNVEDEEMVSLWVVLQLQREPVPFHEERLVLPSLRLS